MESNIFDAYDFNFTNYNTHSIRLMCEYKIPLITAYPKLIISLYNNLNFKKWLIDNNIDIENENRIINSLINAIKMKTENSNNEVILNKISLRDKDLWIKIVDHFLSQDKNINKEFKEYKSDIIVKRKKSLKKNNSKEIEISI